MEEQKRRRFYKTVYKLCKRFLLFHLFCFTFLKRFHFQIKFWQVLPFAGTLDFPVWRKTATQGRGEEKTKTTYQAKMEIPANGKPCGSVRGYRVRMNRLNEFSSTAA